MPAFYDFTDEGRDGPEDVLETDLQQVEALRDYILTLHPAAAPAPMVVAPPAEPVPADGGADEMATGASDAAPAVETEG
jgi:hypothetical protein